MATIDRNQLLADIKLWLPESNVFSDAQILQISELVITRVGDDDSKYPEVLCKSLNAVGQANLAKHSVDGASLRKEKVGDNMEEYDTSVMKDVWKGFIKSLKDICPIFGYNKPVGLGMKINPSEAIVINDCPDSSDLYL